MTSQLKSILKELFTIKSFLWCTFGINFCPECDRWIRDRPKNCKHCGFELDYELHDEGCVW